MRKFTEKLNAILEDIGPSMNLKADIDMRDKRKGKNIIKGFKKEDIPENGKQQHKLKSLQIDKDRFVKNGSPIVPQNVGPNPFGRLR